MNLNLTAATFAEVWNRPLAQIEGVDSLEVYYDPRSLATIIAARPSRPQGRCGWARVERCSLPFQALDAAAAFVIAACWFDSSYPAETS